MIAKVDGVDVNTDVETAVGNYLVTIANGTLTVDPKAVTITAGSDSKTYDGTALTNYSSTATALESSDTHIFNVEMTQESTITNVGTQPNVIAKVDDVPVNTGEEIAVGNYLVTTVNGTLTINPITENVTVTITEHSNSDEIVYNGQEHTVTGYDVAIDNELYTEADFTFSGNAEVKGTDAGTYPMELKPEDFTNTNQNFSNVTFNVKDGALTITPVIVKVSVVDKADGQPIVGNQVVVRNSNGVIIHDWSSTSTEENHEISVLKAGGEYTIIGNAYLGYTRSAEYTLTIDENGNVSYSGTITQDGVLLVENSKTHVEISVVDMVDGDKLAGATVQVKDSEGDVVEEWDSKETENHIIEGLTIFEEYTLCETAAPEGYKISSDCTFTINETGEITTSGLSTTDEEGNTVLLVENSKTHVEISVVDITTKDEIEGAHVQVLAPGNEVVEEWTSTTEIHEVEGLKTNVEYTLRETVAPEGYKISSDCTFTINEEGKVFTNGQEVAVLQVENAMTHVEISVVDITTKAPISDATIKVLAPGNVVVEEWTSGTGNYVIEGLKTNVEYTLRETAAPNRYAAPADYTFEIAPDGRITFTGNRTEDGVLLVENTKTGDLIVSNTVYSDSESDANQEFGFTVTLGDQSINGTYGDMTFESGVATFTLKDGQEKTAANLLYGTTYTVTQVEVEGFTLEKTGDTGTIGQESWTAAFTNTRKTGDLIVTNTVYSDSESDANQEFGFTVTLGDQSINGTYGDMTFESGVATFTLKDGQEKTATGLPTTMTYMVTGPGVSGFQLSESTGVEGTIGNEASTATFKYIKLIDVSVAIRWNDANNQDGKRPSEVSAILKANDEQVGSKVLNDRNEWSDTFENQPSCTQEGTRIKYSWEMEMPATPDYNTLSETTVDGHNTITMFTLTHEPEVTEVKVSIDWDDTENREGFRPESVTVHLLKDNNECEAIVLSNSNNWTHTWANLQKYENATEIDYTVTEDAVANYSTQITKATDGTFTYTVTNSRELEVTEVKVSIVWVDENNREGFRPESVTVHLMKDNNECEAIELSNSNDWTHTWANLQKYENAAAIDYKVTEEEVANYSTQIEASDAPLTYNVTNSRTVEETEVTVSIVWDDDNDTNGLRPDNVISSLKLFANSAEKTENKWTALSNGSYVWTGLPKYADGQEIEYTISQEKLNNYNDPVITYSGTRWEYTVTNTICGVIFTNEGNSTTLTLTNPIALQEVSIPTPVDVDHVDIQREFIPETAATVYLPFTIAAENVEGGTFYSFTDVNETKDPWEVSYTEVTGNIAANTPYIFLPDNLHGGKITVNNGENKLSVCTANAQTTHDAERQWEFIGTYQPIKWLSDSEAEGYTAERADEIGSVYGFAASSATVGTTEFTAGQFVKVASGAYIKPYRAYLKRTTTSGARGRNGISSPELPATMNVVLISANGVTVSVGTINLDCESGDWYSLDGRKLDAQPTKKGMYIHNNKKVIIK